MTMKFYLIINLFAFITTSLSKLNVPRVLLPLFKELPITFTLESTDGDCYRWWVAEEDIVVIEPFDFVKELQCWRKAIVKTSPNCATRSVAAVLAEDIRSKQVVRCDVIVDTISSLSISTTTKELLLEDAPEAFEVRASDSQGNCFTTLEGILFEWTVTCLGSNKEEILLRFIKFKDSPYKTTPSITKMEEQNHRGCIVLMEGIKTGSAKAFAKLPYKEYSHIKSAEVTLTVSANLIIVPSQVHSMVGDEITFTILQLKRGNKEQISLPHTQYHLKVESEDLATAIGGGTILTLRKGTTKVVLYDRNVNMDDSNVKLPSAELNVIEPHKILITTFPHRSSAVLISENVDIAMEVYSRDNYLIHLGPNVHAVLKVNQIFHVHEITANGTWLTGWPIKEGRSQIHAHFKGTEGAKVKIDSTADLEVYPRIILTPSEVVFPWDPETRPTSVMQLKASGGDGLFLWSSSNHTVGMVSQTGLVRIHNYGYFEVSVSMQRNHYNRQYTKFHVVFPSRLEITDFIMETEIGASVYLHVALYADLLSSSEDGTYSQVPISHCQDVNFDVEVSNDNFIYNRSDVIQPVGISCANVALVGLKSGSSKIVVSCIIGGRKLEDNVTLIAFNPLSLVYPKCEIVLALGCFTELVFSGGPSILKTRSDYKREVSVTNIDVIKAVDKTNAIDKFIIEVTCRKLGEANVTFTMGNMPTLPHCKYRAYSKTVTIVCGQPEKIQLRPALQDEDSNRCPLNVDENRVIAYSGKDIHVDVNVFDAQGRIFLDASSLLFRWDIRPKDMAKIHNQNGIYKNDQTKTGLNYLDNNYQLITPLKKNGEMHLIAHAVGYKKEVLRKSKATCINCDSNNRKVVGEFLKKAAAQLLLVDHAVVTPSEINICNNAMNKKVISVIGGSGYFEFKLSAKDVALIKYNSVTREIEVTPKNDGNTEIMVTDLCLPSQSPIVNVRVVSIAIIRVDMSEKVQIGRCIPCTVRFYDETDNLLSLNDTAAINIAINLSRDIVKVKRLVIKNQGNARNSGEAHFIVTGLELGSANLAFSIKSGAKDIKSAPIELMVFPPLRISPRNATLLIGSTFQFTSNGGPFPDCTIEYKIDKPQIAYVNEFGVAKGLKYGIASVSARAIGINPSTRQKVVYSEDKIMVEIISLTGLKIAAPLTRFICGSTVPVWITGVPEKISASILANVEPSIRFEWAVDDSDIVKIVGIFEHLGIVYGQEDNIAVRLKGLKAGKTILRLTAVVSGSVLNKSKQQSVTLKTHLHIDVFEKLSLNIPNDVNGKEILMAPFSSILLHTNMDDILNIKYSVSNGRDPLTETTDKLDGASKTIIKVSSSGVIESFGNTGIAMVVIEATDQEYLTQQMTLVVEVKSIHYMMLKADAKWKVKHSKMLSSIPLGSEFILRTHYYDSTGSKFTCGNLQLHVRNSRLDFVKVSPTCCNDSMLVSTRRKGNSVVKVWGEGYRRTADYIKLNVKQAITPTLDTLTIGDIVCLQTPLEPNKGDAVARWSVSNKCLQLLDNSKGIIRVVTAAATEVYLTHDLHQGSPIKIAIEPPNTIRTLEDTKKHVTNTPLRKPYSIPLLFGIVNQPERIKNTHDLLFCYSLWAGTVETISYPYSQLIRISVI
ncbi:nuclear pore membrane glycoprotein 210 isoform X2 [Agrilus planipennis]|uniref:Nuclear pore membrane glycoprotein 210 isoform X2 n=1 Tax=Agrilus planipennis TaxID=224129 RepID=A0A1W4XMJ3_AGRPL|nr:nuclear pore membrane glycoprotein 210 isoform X2 [Agrilus planipennis]